jgi:hypothetical protein
MTNEEHMRHTIALLDWLEARALSPVNAAAVVGMAACSLFADRAAAADFIAVLQRFADATFPQRRTAP